ncbi:MAG: nucleoid-associated protein, YbaB/EbfC family [Candidatus Binatia bacterium]|nr:MAG: nucleoid-associated protein, YbaB/EbfC family [Candidatus Binatia bacterium]
MAKGIGSLGDIFAQAQELQKRLAKVQEEVAALTVQATAGGGMVTVEMNGKLEVIRVTIDPQVVASGDVEMLEDLVKAAVNQAIHKAQQAVAEEMRKVTGGLKIPGFSV